MATKEEIIKQNLEFVYGKRTNDVLDDPDKVSYRRTKPKFVDLDAITKFEGEHDFLAPSFPCTVYVPEDSVPYPSFEHALLATKFKAVEKRQEVRATPLIRDVKRLISKEKNNPSTIHGDWTDRCLAIAETLLVDKFIRNKPLRERLMKTGRRSLTFQNDYGDMFWGLDEQQKGQNNLGKLLEKVRQSIDQGEDLDLWVKGQVKLLEPDKVRIEVIVTKSGVRVDEDCTAFHQRAKLLIGKAEDLCDLVAAHPTVSRSHALLLVTKDTTSPVKVVDLGSANGTKLNGQSVAAFAITSVPDGAVLTFGASSRAYSFVVDTAADVKRREDLLRKIAADPVGVTGASAAAQAENTVFVGNISFEATERDVEAFFSQCGTITQLSVPKDRSGANLHKGIAFVTFSAFNGVMQALARDGDELCGRSVKVKKSEGRKAAPEGATRGGTTTGGQGPSAAPQREQQPSQRLGGGRDGGAPKQGYDERTTHSRSDEAASRTRERETNAGAKTRGRSRSRSPIRASRREDRPDGDDGRPDRRDRSHSRGRGSGRGRSPSRSPPRRRQDSRDRGWDRGREIHRDRDGKRDRVRDRGSNRDSRDRGDRRGRDSRQRRSASKSPPRRHHQRARDSSLSPPRRTQRDSPSPSPPRRHHQRARDSSPSPPRRTQRDTPGPSPSRGVKRESSSSSPPRHGKRSSPSSSPPRRPQQAGRHSPSPSPPRRPVKDSPSPSPPRRRPASGSSPSLSPPRRHCTASPSPSPPRRPRYYSD